MKEKMRILVIGLFVLALLGGGYLLQDAQAQDPIQIVGDEPLRTVSVSGSGQVSTQPDRAVLRLGVQTEAESAEEAFTQNAEQMNALLGALEEADLASEDIQTQTIQLRPRYEEQDGSRELVGYTAVNIVEVTVRSIDDLGSILDAAVAAGSNTVEDIRFEISDLSDLLEQARQMAMDDARNKAEQLASLAGASLGEVLTIQEMGQGPQPVVRGLGAEAAAVPIQPGTESVQVSVQVTWRLQTPEGEGVSPQVMLSPTSGPPGSAVQISVSGFPAETPVEIGVGRWRSEYEVVATSSTDVSGTLDTEVDIPDFAESGERWVVVVATEESGSEPGGLKITSNIFNVLGQG